MPASHDQRPFKAGILQCSRDAISRTPHGWTNPIAVKSRAHCFLNPWSQCCLGDCSTAPDYPMWRPGQHQAGGKLSKIFDNRFLDGRVVRKLSSLAQPLFQR